MDLSALWSRCRHYRRCLFRCSAFHASTFLPPLTPRALPRFLATTEALSPSGRGSSGLSSGHERRSFPDRDPWFMSLQLPTILSPPTPRTPAPALTALPQVRSRICRSRFRIDFRSGLRLFPRRLANASGRIEFIIFLIMDWLFASGCSPPRLSATQLPSATDSQCSARRGLPPRRWCALSGARGALLATPIAHQSVRPKIDLHA
jgi:hypothetical protein